MENIITRLAKHSDLERVAELFDLYRQFYSRPSDIQLAKDFISQRFTNNESVIFIAEDSQQSIVGFCQLYPTFCSVLAAPIFILYDLFVIDVARKNGVGRCLLLQSETYVKSKGAKRLDLTTARDNVSAQSLYESLDWQKDEVFLGYNKVV